jgi:predicted Zn-dependent peptidase
LTAAQFQHTFPNGLTLLAERMDHVRSASLYLLVPAGFTHDPADRPGLATLLTELLTRGAGSRDSRQLALDLDNLGCDRSESVGPFNLILSAGTLARNLPQVLPIYADIVRRPHLPEGELDPARELALQDLLGLEDSPQEKVVLELKNRYYPSPYGRNRYGTEAGLTATTIADVKAQFDRRVSAAGAILSVAGAVDWPRLKDQVGELFGDWPGGTATLPAPGPASPQSGHVEKDTQQTQISLAFPSVPLGHPDYYAARGAVGVLSGGMSARLFTEVREKRGLCYSVYASHDAVKDRAAVVGYAGTRSDRAQQTLDVMAAEFRKLPEGVSDDELDRVKASLKTGLVMQQESTAARAGSMAGDWFHLGRVRPVDEVRAAIDALTPAAVAAHAARFPAGTLTVVTLGPDPLTVPE